MSVIRSPRALLCFGTFSLSFALSSQPHFADAQNPRAAASPQPVVRAAPEALEANALGAHGPYEDPLSATVSMASAEEGTVTLSLHVENHSDQDMAAVSSIEVQDGMSEPVMPAVVDAEPWDLDAAAVDDSELTVEALPDAPYKIESLVSAVGETGEVHGTLAETYILVEGGVAKEIDFAQWLPLVNTSEPVGEDIDPKSEPGAGGEP